jgi:hypothetical protein
VSFFTKIRGIEIEVVIDRDYGYEPDTNAHCVDWHTVPDLNLEEDESNAIDQEVYKFLETAYNHD